MLMSSMIYNCTEPQQHGIYLFFLFLFPILFLFFEGAKIVNGDVTHVFVFQ